MARRNPRQSKRRRQTNDTMQSAADLPQNPNHFLNRFPSYSDYSSFLGEHPNRTGISKQQYKGLSPRRRRQGGGGGGGGQQPPDFSQPPSSYVPPIIPPGAQPTPQTGATGGYHYDPAHPTAGYATLPAGQDWWSSQVPLFSQGGYTANGQKMDQMGSINTGNTMPEPVGGPNVRMYQWGHEPTWAEFVQNYGALPPSTTEAAPGSYPFSGMGYQAPPENYSHYLNPGVGAITRQQVLDWQAAGPNTTDYYDPGDTVAGSVWNTANTPYAASFSGPTGNIYGAPGRDRVYGNPVAPNYYDPYTEYQMLRDVMKPNTFGGANDAQQQQLITQAFGGMATPQTSLPRLDYYRYEMGAYGPPGNPWESYATQHGGIPASQRYAGQMGG